MKEMQTTEIEKSISHILIEIIEYIPNSVVSKTIIRKTTGNISVVAIDTGEALAEKIGVSAPGLKATMTAYDAAAQQGKADPLGKVPERFAPQDTPPFYAVDCSLDSANGVPCSAMTLGGLAVEEGTGNVLRGDGSVIEGLYAAGRNAVGVCSNAYVSGLSIADCVFSGRRAGRHAALLASEE